MRTIVCLLGPTASGKTEVALQLAKKINAEIISCDSMQVYKRVDIATSKPTKRQRKTIPHHLFDITSPCREYNAARFRTSCLKVIKDIHKRGKLPLIVAGTGLYLRALLDGLFSGPGGNLPLRKRLYEQARKYGGTYLFKRLRKLDPQTAAGIHPNDLRRIIRALEIYKLTGKPISRWKEKAMGIRDKYNVQIFGLRRKRDELYARIDNRVDKMFRQGLVAEIRKFSKRKVSRTAKSLLGYKEIAGLLEGKYSCDEARRLLKRNTRHYAKRQISWFKKEKGVRWLEVGRKDTPKAIAQKILLGLRC